MSILDYVDLRQRLIAHHNLRQSTDTNGLLFVCIYIYIYKYIIDFN